MLADTVGASTAAPSLRLSTSIWPGASRKNVRVRGSRTSSSAGAPACGAPREERVGGWAGSVRGCGRPSRASGHPSPGPARQACDTPTGASPQSPARTTTVRPSTGDLRLALEDEEALLVGVHVLVEAASGRQLAGGEAGRGPSPRTVDVRRAGEARAPALIAGRHRRDGRTGTGDVVARHVQSAYTARRASASAHRGIVRPRAECGRSSVCSDSERRGTVTRMDLDLQGRVYLVVLGGSRGIGNAVATALAGEGATVVICGRDAEAVQRAADAAGATGDRGVRRRERPGLGPALVAAIGERHGRLDGIVHNAGRFGGGPLESLAREGLHDGLATKVMGPLELTQEALGLLRAGDRPAMVTLSGMTALRVVPGAAVTAIANQSVIALTSLPRRRAARRRHPGRTASPATRSPARTLAPAPSPKPRGSPRSRRGTRSSSGSAWDTPAGTPGGDRRAHRLAAVGGRELRQRHLDARRRRPAADRRRLSGPGSPPGPSRGGRRRRPPPSHRQPPARRDAGPAAPAR